MKISGIFNINNSLDVACNHLFGPAMQVRLSKLRIGSNQQKQRERVYQILDGVAKQQRTKRVEDLLRITRCVEWNIEEIGQLTIYIKELRLYNLKIIIIILLLLLLLL